MKRFNSKVKLAAVGGAIVIALALAKHFHVQEFLQSALEQVKALGPWGPALFVIIYVIAAVSFIPGSFLTLGAGAIFGLLWGFVAVSVGSIAGAVAAFLIGRYLARDSISKKIEGNEKFKAIDSAVAKEGWKIVLLVRLSPIFPFNLVNYAFGLTKVCLKEYFLASWIGMIPGTLMYVYLGSVAGDLAAAGAGARSKTPMEWLLYGVGLAATVLVTVYVTRIAKKALESKVQT